MVKTTKDLPCRRASKKFTAGGSHSDKAARTPELATAADLPNSQSPGPLPPLCILLSNVLFYSLPGNVLRAGDVTALDSSSVFRLLTTRSSTISLVV